MALIKAVKGTIFTGEPSADTFTIGNASVANVVSNSYIAGANAKSEDNKPDDQFANWEKVIHKDGYVVADDALKVEDGDYLSGNEQFLKPLDDKSYYQIFSNGFNEAWDEALAKPPNGLTWMSGDQITASDDYKPVYTISASSGNIGNMSWNGDTINFKLNPFFKEEKTELKTTGMFVLEYEYYGAGEGKYLMDEIQRRLGVEISRHTLDGRQYVVMCNIQDKVDHYDTKLLDKLAITLLNPIECLVGEYVTYSIFPDGPSYNYHGHMFQKVLLGAINDKEIYAWLRKS